MSEKDNSLSAASLLANLASKHLAKNGLSSGWLLLGALGGISVLAVVLLINSEPPQIDCDHYSGPAYMNCQDTNAAGELIGDSHQERGQALLDEGKYDDALDELDEALHLDPSDYRSRFNKARALFKLGQIELADKEYETLVQASPYPLAAYSRRAAMYAEIGDFARAILECTHAIDLSPHDNDMHLQRALMYLRAGAPGQALADINPVLALHPEHFNALRLSASAQLNSGKFVEAIRQFDRAIALAPGNDPYPELWHGRAKAILSQNQTPSSTDRQRAMDDMKAASDQDGTANAWQNQICYGLALLDYAVEALQYCDLGLTMAPDNSAILDSRAYTYSRLARWTEAVADWNKAIALSPDNAVFIFGRGFAYEQLSDLQSANRDYSAARFTDKDIDKTMEDLGIVSGTPGIPKGPKVWR